MTFKSHFLKKIDDFQNTKLKFLVTFNKQNKNCIVEFLGYMGFFARFPFLYVNVARPSNLQTRFTIFSKTAMFSPSGLARFFARFAAILKKQSSVLRA